jgi:hypothetical protein
VADPATDVAVLQEEVKPARKPTRKAEKLVALEDGATPAEKPRKSRSKAK